MNCNLMAETETRVKDSKTHFAGRAWLQFGVFVGHFFSSSSTPSVAMKFHWWVFSPVVFPWTGQAQQAGTVTPEESLERVGTLGGRNIQLVTSFDVE